MTENWYIILGLEFDPDPVTDERAIEQRIEEKRRFWLDRRNDLSHGEEYRRYSEMLSEIRKDMIGKDNIRAQLIQDACDRTYGAIDKVLNLFRRGGEIAQDTVESIASKKKFDAEAIRRRASVLGIRIIASKGGDYQAIYDKYYRTKPQNADKFSGMNARLESFHAADFYEFLCQGRPVRSPQNLSCDELRQMARDKRKKEFYKNDSVSSAGSKLCGLCEECFQDDASKQVYDRYLEYSRRKAVLEEVKEFFGYAGELSQEQCSDAVDQLTVGFRNRKEAEALFTAFCKIEKIPLPASGGARERRVRVCRCGCTNDVSDGRSVCRACGLELQLRCPQCGAVSDADVNVCRCGFRLDGIDRTMALCELAAGALDAMDLDVAEACLADADRFWPGSGRVSGLRDRLTELKSRIGQAVEEMRRACREKRYYEAGGQLEKIKRSFPGYSDPEAEAEIQSAVRAAEELRQRAQSAGSEQEILEACARAYEVCSDCPGISRIAALYPPAAPAGLVISGDSAARANVLSWAKSVSPGPVCYWAVRREGEVPVSPQDGTLVYHGSGCGASDRDIRPGTPYYYAVFAERVGVFSYISACGRAEGNLFEISGVRVDPDDGVLRLSWEPAAENASVGVERTDPLGETEWINGAGRSGYIDRRLENDREYRYRVFLTYSIGGREASTAGVQVYGTPTKLPKPIEKLAVRPKQKGEFRIEWENPEDAQLRFFWSPRKPALCCGDRVPLSELESGMKALSVQKTAEDAGTFQYEGGGPMYLSAATVKGSLAVMGTVARANWVEGVRIRKAGLVNGKIMLLLEEVPGDSTGFAVLYRHDRFPADISDAEAERKYVPRKQFQYDSGLVIDSNEPKDYYFSVYAEYRRDGESDYSMATDYRFSNVEKETITYSIEVRRSLFGQKSVKMVFEGRDPAFQLPDIDIIAAQGGMPIYRESGTVFYQIPAQKASGSVQVSIPLEKGVAGETYIRPFLKDESLAERYVLRIKPKSDYKIS